MHSLTSSSFIIYLWGETFGLRTVLFIFENFDQKKPKKEFQNAKIFSQKSDDLNRFLFMDKIYFKSQILVHEYVPLLDHFCIPVL